MQPTPQRFAVTKVSSREPVDAGHDLGPGSNVFQPRQPLSDDIGAVGCNITADFYGQDHCNL
jgi:hypothetical protein